MSRQRYPEEFKIEAVKQVTEKGKPVAEVAQRLGMSVHSLYAWIKVYSKPQEQRQQDNDCSGLLTPDTFLGENGRHTEVFDEQTT
ncbi:transposase, partial [Pseudomonas monteilii]|uniref:transposase n=1 Tax=Pseudomonas monteilii TaxID=76759 RepID=UPI001E4BAFEA